MNNNTAIPFHHYTFIVYIFSLFRQEIFQELSIKWHFLQGFSKGNCDLQLLENIKEASKVSLLVLLRWYQRVWGLFTRVGNYLSLSFSDQLNFGPLFSILSFLHSFNFSFFFICFFIFCFPIVTYFFSLICSPSPSCFSYAPSSPSLLLVITTLHSFFGFFSVFAPKLPEEFSANCLASCPT